VYLDQYTGHVVHLNYHRELAWPIRFTRDLYPLHFGTFGGNLTRILWIIVGLAAAFLYVTGLLMWWNRSILPALRRHRRRREMQLVGDAMIADPVGH
jgi:uncharacterized iron-regulated membrane protein